jgi:hypothetical protein
MSEPRIQTVIPGYGPDDFALAVIKSVQMRLDFGKQPELSEHQNQVLEDAIVWCIIAYGGRVENIPAAATAPDTEQR